MTTESGSAAIGTADREPYLGMRDHAETALRILAEWFGIDPRSNRLHYRAWEEGANSAFQTGHDLLGIDPSGFSTVLQVGSFMERAIATATVPLHEVLEPTGAIQPLVQRAMAIRTILCAIEVVEERTRFYSQLAAAAVHYAPDRESEFVAYVAESDTAVALRVASQLSVSKALRVVQLRDGEPGVVEPKLLSHLYVCHSAASLVQALPMLPSSIGMVMFIEADGSDYATHFGIFAKNGERLFLYRDIEEETHPLQKSMRRRPGRILAERIGRNWFPYDLAGVEWDEDGARFRRRASASTSLSAAAFGNNQHLYPLTPLDTLTPDCLLWAALVFDLIKANVFREDFRCSELSYVARAATVSAAPGLLGSVSTDTLLPVPADMRAVQHQLVSSALSSVRAKRSYGVATGRNDWLMDQFSDQINESLIDLAPHYGHLPSLLEHPTSKTTDKYHFIPSMRVGEHHVVCSQRGVGLVKDGNHHFDLEREATWLKLQNPDAIGTPEKLDADRHFVARYNQALQVKLLLNDRWENEIDSLRKVLLARANELFPTWCDQLRSGSFALPVYVPLRSLCPDLHFPPGLAIQRRNALQVEAISVLRDKAHSTRRERSYSHLLQGGRGLDNLALGRSENAAPYYFSDRSNLACVITRTAATFVAAWTVNNWEALAELLHWRPAQLPPLLRLWHSADEYIGNSILDRVDPSDWVIKHPLKTSIRFSAVLSKAAYRNLTGKNEAIKPARVDDQHLRILRGSNNRVRKALKANGFLID
jgi:hypothetical protein